ncbi:Succinate dehydrogenase cytochrome b-556 subunit [Thioalkalivibrio nitratireducens DSM 14787]|uniref:Succinate dehydrogenase cytochrome b556 subunit n=1 Tax=Thioalkalivibrio nitratireducens (strain DSM 14787 / UNIQEM 213 / ALEN2) TaxID=1255043 RepID=L0DVQ1_THIND|nr:succinate dehydrogenase, cytochrome b556 subunit [Thioalkalivibrio nitratireducens]AGA33113.1 Succinate dehydrogenase cytochrome b-556 subunit [Thioalkalivibrio nitratireducens DSM 14787]
MASVVRPVFLDLRRIRLPVNALVSILHRVTGVLLIVSIPLALWLFAVSLSGPEGFERAVGAIRHPLGLLALLGWFWLLTHHFFAGVRFLLLEFGIGETREASRTTAWWALGAGLVAALLLWAMFL